MSRIHSADRKSGTVAQYGAGACRRPARSRKVPMAKVAVIAKITALPGMRDEVASVLNDVVTATNDEPGTLFYAMNLDKAETDVIWFYEVYADDAALAAHGGSEAMKAAGGKLRDKAAGRPELHIVELVAGKGLPV